MAGDALSAVEHVFRQERGRVLAGLMRRFGDLGLAEDVLQEACRKALERWPRTGIPDHPAAWLNVKETVFGTRACLTIVGQGMQRQRYVRLDSR